MVCRIAQVVNGRSREGAWIEIPISVFTPKNIKVAPVRERGLKFLSQALEQTISGRSREGAWIEMLAMQDDLVNMQVAPVRERGLKFHRQCVVVSVCKSLP